MKDLTKIYLEAARMVAENEIRCSCVAVYCAATGEVARHYGISFCRELKHYNSTFGFSPVLVTDLTRNERVLCLTLMAAAWKDLV